MNWQKIIKDFGKRNPDVTIGEVFDNSAIIISSVKFSKLVFAGVNDMLAFDDNGYNILKFFEHGGYYFSDYGWEKNTTRCNNEVSC